MKSINILFTSAGRRVELLRCFRQAYKTLGLEGNLIVTDIDPLAPTLQLADKPYIVPRVMDAEYVPTLLNICKHESVDLIFPLIDPDIPILAQHHDEFEAIGTKLAVIPESATSIIGDKWTTYQFFHSLQLPTPKSWLPEELDHTDIEFPLFIKPRNGSAAKDTFKVNNKRELSFFSEYVSNPIIQEYLPGAEITCDIVCNLKGKMLGLVMRQRIEVRSGEVSKGFTVFNDEIANSCKIIAEALPARGPITVQCKLKDGKPFFTEINARFGGGLPLGIKAGVDSPCWLLAETAGIPSDIPPVGTYQTNLKMTRFDETFFLTDLEERETNRSRTMETDTSPKGSALNEELAIAHI